MCSVTEIYAGIIRKTLKEKADRCDQVTVQNFSNQKTL